MNLNYFSEFLTLAETRNYWEAAERLFLNQSTLSKHIKAMEKELGIPLFDRTTRKVTLTEFGQTLLPYARSMAQLQSEYTTALARKQHEHQGLIMLGSISSMKRYHITDLISDYQTQYPAYNIHVIENDTQRLKQMLLQRKCELAFLRESAVNFADHDGILRIPYTADDIVAVLPESHPLAEQTVISIQALAEEKLCLPKRNTILYNLCCEACQQAGFLPNIIYDSHYIGSIVDMLVQNKAIGLMTCRQIDPLISRSGPNRPPVVTRPIEPGISTQISLCFLQNEELSEGAKLFIQFFQAQ